jgi:hypothetical protein
MIIDNVFIALLAGIPSNGLAGALLLESCQCGERRIFELEPILDGALQNLTSTKPGVEAFEQSS